MKNSILLYFLLHSILSFSQNLSVDNIPENIKKDASAVLRFSHTNVEFQATNKMKITQNFALTVLNESGLMYAYNFENYDASTKIKEFEAKLFDAAGNELKKYKRSELRDVSAADGFSLYLDDRIQYYDITPFSYPFTVQYSIETTTSNTLFFPSFMPVLGYDVGIENSDFTLVNLTNSAIRKKEENFSYHKVEKIENDHSLIYKIENISPIKDEVLSPALSELTPLVLFSPSEFELEGIKGKFKNWEEFGKWYYDNLLPGRQELTTKDKAKAIELVKGISDPLEKVKVLYQFLQDKTRYVNVSIGIGGLQPLMAKDVGEKSYGDCKALSNYMVSLLKAVGIEAFHTIVYGENLKKLSLDKDFASFQGNHMIVNVPLENDTIWLECTSQQTAFNYLGRFTDDRYVLSVESDGGKLTKTQSFPFDTNKEIIIGKGEIFANGNMNAEFQIEDSGLQYDLVYRIDFQNPKEQNKSLQNLFDDLPNLTIQKFNLENNRDKAVFKQDVSIESKQYAQVFGNSIVIRVIPFGLRKTNLKKDDKRTFPMEIRFGYTDELEYELKIPTGFKLSEIPEPIIYSGKFGTYLMNVTKMENNILKINRTLIIKDGIYPKENYNEYVEFNRKISSFDHTKILLEKI